MLADLIKEVPEGATRYFTCPECGSPKKSFGITVVDDSAKFGCFRASCGYRGVVPLKADLTRLEGRITSPPSLRQVAGEKTTSFEVPKEWLRGAATADAYSMLSRYHCLPAYRNKLFTCYYDLAQERLVILVKDLNGKVTGGVGRLVIPKKGQPKVYNYGDVSIPFRCGNSPTAVIVEDCFSAIACANYNLTGVALLGTNIKEGYWPYFDTYSKLYVALDKDARAKSIKLWGQMKSRGYDADIIFLEEDIKNNPEQLKDLT
jgi:hypothetical protein